MSHPHKAVIKSLIGMIMPHPYKAVIKHQQQTTSRYPAISGDLLENGTVIGQFWRDPVEDGYVPPIEYRFVDKDARDRFDDFANCLSISESIEALLPW